MNGMNMEPTPPDSSESNDGLNNSPKEAFQPLQYLQEDPDGMANQSSHPQFQQVSLGVAATGNRLTVPAACVACRTKHLKCDGAKPCSRCSSYGIDCSYVRSRRGYKGPRRVPPKEQTPATPTAAYSYPKNAIEYPGQLSGSKSQVAVPNTNEMQRALPRLPGVNSRANSMLNLENDQPALETSPYSPAAMRERCMESFFHYFHPAHPFLLPKAFLSARLRAKSYPHLETAMRYVGSHFVQSAPIAALEQEARLALVRNPMRDGFTVQALLLLCIALDGHTEDKAALEFLIQAQDLALEIGMQQREFAVIHGENLSVLEESWRRTWWELYIVDGMIAGVHQKSSFRFSRLPASVMLPCEEYEFNSGRIPTPRSIEDFDDEAFGDEDITFSSFAYRISSIRNLGRILAIQEVVFGDDPIIDKTDAYLVNWGLHLPSSKKLAIDSGGQVDEMLFQAQMITNASSILLHRPHSQLDTAVVRNVTSCAPFRQIIGGQVYNVHAAKIIQAAENITKLIQMPTPLANHTHFFTCVITLASLVHLSCWAALLPLSQDDNLKQQIRLNTGALKTISEVWPNASCVGFQVKTVAQEVFASRKAAADEGFWSSFTNEEMMRSIIEDEEIVNSFQLT